MFRELEKEKKCIQCDVADDIIDKGSKEKSVKENRKEEES